jgi:putative PIN family toxin of toxin-antitoxin system
MLRVVLDIDVILIAIISEGKKRDLLKGGIANQYSIITSDLILKELVTVLRRPKFKTNEDEAHRIILTLIRTTDCVNVTSKLKAVKEDPKDDMILETVVDGGADMIVTGDSHLLKLEDV